jgi:fatty acid desaturase
VQHPDEFIEALPDRPPAEAVRTLSRIEPARALAAIAGEWLMIAAAIAISESWWNPALYLAVLIFIAVRQHALLIIGHDASHGTLLPDRRWNDWVADLTLYWPTFLSVGTYRFFHRDHHRYLAGERDGNRVLWQTHDAAGRLTRHWTYPKSRAGLAAKLLAKLCLLRGASWVVKGTLSMLAQPEFRRGSWWYVLARTAYYGAVAALLTDLGLWRQFLLYWLLPFCTWQVMIQYARLICEHSAVRATAAPYHLTRTILPRLWERLLILPRNIGYHHEHHWYPGVPFYNLPELHALLVRETRFGRAAEIQPGVMAALHACTIAAAPVSAAAEGRPAE